MNMYSSHKATSVDDEYAAWKADVYYNIHRFPTHVATEVLDKIKTLDLLSLFSNDMPPHVAASWIINHYTN